MRMLMAVGCIAAAVTVGGGVRAESGPQQPGQQGTEAYRIEEVTVTARKRTERLQDVPDAITVLDSQAMADLGAVDLGGLNVALSNFQLRETQQPGTALISMRGISMQRFQEPPVAIVIDGVQLTSQYQILQSLYAIQQIEVLRGPQGSLYGRNALAGAINITTQRPADHLEGLVRVGYAEGDTRSIEGRLSAPLVHDRARLSLLGVYRRTDGLIENQFLRRKVDFEKLTYGRGRLEWSLTDSATLDLRLAREERDGGVAWFSNFPDQNVNNTDVPIQSGSLGRGTRKLADASATLRWNLAAVAVSATGAYSKLRDDYFQDIDFEPPGFIDGDQFVDGESRSLEIRLSGPDNARLTWLAGTYLADFDQDVTTLLQIAPCFFLDPFACSLGPVDRATAITVPFGINRNNNHSHAIFGQLGYHLVSGLDLTLGIRYDRDRRRQLSVVEGVTRSKTFSELQPKISLAYRWNASWMTYLTASKGFRSGAFNGTDYITRRYDAESLWNYEFGVKSDLLARRLRANAALFYMDDRNRQEYVIQPGSGAQTIFNVPRSHVMGLDFDATALLTSSLDVSAGIGWIDTEVDRSSAAIEQTFGRSFVGNKLPGVPHFTVNAGVQHRHALGASVLLRTRLDWSLKKGLHWSLGNVADEQNPVQLVNLRVSAERGALSLTAYAENLFDKKYYAEVAMPGFGAINPTPGGFRARPRQLGLQAEWAF